MKVFAYSALYYMPQHSFGILLINLAIETKQVSDRSMRVYFSPFYEIMTDRPTDRQTDRRTQREDSLPIGN